MKTYLLLTAALVLALTGCATVRTVDIAPQNGSEVVRAADLADSQVRYQVTLTDGRQFEAIRLQSTATSLSWVDPDMEIGHAFPRSQIKDLTYIKGDVRYSVDPAQFEERSPRMGSVSVGPSRRGSISEMNMRAQRQKAQVTLADGAPLMVASLQVTPDSTSWMDPQTGHFETVATEDIREITFIDHGAGAVEGAGIGLLTGVAVGALLGFAGGDTPSSCNFWCPTAGEMALFGAILLGGSGGLLGLVVGAAGGHRDTYRFNIPASEPQVASDEGRSIVLKNIPRR